VKPIQGRSGKIPLGGTADGQRELGLGRSHYHSKRVRENRISADKAARCIRCVSDES